MASKENQHFVPKFYLRKFSWEHNQKQIGVFNSETELFVERAKLKSQAYKKYFYGQDGRIEEILSGIEGDAASLLRKIEEENYVPKLKTEDYGEALFFAILSNLRNPIISQNLEESHDQIFGEAYKDHDEYKLFWEIHKKYDNEIERALTGIATAFEASMDLNLKLIVNKTNTPFIISDNPVVKYNQYLEKRDAKRGITGFGSKGIQILYPISPKKILIFFDQLVYRIGNKKQYILETNNDNEIDQINLLQFLNCEKIIFFNHEINEDKIRAYFNKSKKYDKANKVLVTKHRISDHIRKKTKSGHLLVSTTTDCRIKLNLHCIKETKKAKTRELDVGRIQVRKRAEQMLKRKYHH